MIACNSKRKESLYMVSIMLVGILLIESSSLCFAQNVVWTVTDNPSGSDDSPLAITADDTYIYVAGYDLFPGPSNHQWRIQKRNKSDGSVVQDVNDNPSSAADVPIAIICDDTYVYMGGHDRVPGYERWRIQKRNKSDLSVVWTRTDIESNSSIAWALTDDDTYIYEAGFSFCPGDNQWRIKKRNKSDGSVVWDVNEDPSTNADEALAITSDDTYIYVAGKDYSPGNYQWKIQKRNKSNGDVVWDVNDNLSNYDDVARSITSDDTYIYIAGCSLGPGNNQWIIQKRNKSDGSLVWDVNDNPSNYDDVAQSITSDGAYIYVAGYDSLPGNTQWRIQKRNKSDGSIVWTETDNPSSAYDTASSITSDGTYIYVAGCDSPQGDMQWRILKIQAAPIETIVDIDPDTLNRKSHGKWLTVYITLTEGHDVAEIDMTTIAITQLQGQSCAPDYYQTADLSFIPQVGDRDEDGIDDLTVKFDRQVLLLNLCLDDVSIMIEGELTTSERFSGSDSIRIIDRGK